MLLERNNESIGDLQRISVWPPGLIHATYPATEVAGFICEVPLRRLEGEPPQGDFATEARSFNCWASSIDKPYVAAQNLTRSSIKVYFHQIIRFNKVAFVGSEW